MEHEETEITNFSAEISVWLQENILKILYFA